MNCIAFKTVVLCVVCVSAMAIVLTGCQSLKESSKYQFNEGFYTLRKGPHQTEKLYLLTGSDTIKAYTKAMLRSGHIDTSKIMLFAFPSRKPDTFKEYAFRRNSLDLDVLTVLFKYRPAIRGFPPQFNATFNGAVYLGYRTDQYRLTYRATPLHLFNRDITHYGYSFGVFTGLGSARIDEFVTQNALNYEYDGLVNLTGIAVIGALNKLTAGLTVGTDHLLDKNHRLWLNNGKPWIGISIGLNLN